MELVALTVVKINWSIQLIWNELDKINWALSINNEVYNCAKICRLQLVKIDDTSLECPLLGVYCITCEAPERAVG